MSKQLTDEQIDVLLASIVSETIVSDSVIDEIVDSPQIWWAVQRNIATQKVADAAPWPPSFNWIRFFSFATPIVAALVIGVAVFTFRPTQKTETAGLQQNEGLSVSKIATVPPSEPAAPSLDNDLSLNKIAVVAARKKRSLSPSQNSSRIISTKKQPRPAVTENEEVKSDFIALSYAQNPSSGQIVRVKVPSSMKVTLGMVDRVDRPSELVDAEVVVGDDGMTHAIRFIRQ